MATTIGSTNLNALFGNTATTSSASSTTSKNALGKDQFLNLLVAQLKNQDPLNPMKDTEFISQLAQFSSLEQMSNLSSSMGDFVKQQNLMNASAMIGKQVTTGSGLSGVVTKVSTDGTTISLYIGDQKVSMSDITNISNPTS